MVFYGCVFDMLLFKSAEGKVLESMQMKWRFADICFPISKKGTGETAAAGAPGGQNQRR